jgi:hypothetical protein
MYMVRAVRNIYEIQVTAHVHNPFVPYLCSNDWTHVTVTKQNLKFSQCCHLLSHVRVLETRPPLPLNLSQTVRRRTSSKYKKCSFWKQ